MESKLAALKHYVYELEYALKTENVDMVKNISRVIKEKVDEVEYNFNMLTNSATGIYYRHINTVDFVYKPIEVADPFKGNYLEKFSASRTYDLTKAGAINVHNEFWQDHSILKTNVFGVVPVDMISDEALYTLLKLGWERVEVDVLDFSNSTTDERDIFDFCEGNFSNYLAIREEQTGDVLVLNFVS